MASSPSTEVPSRSRLRSWLAKPRVSRSLLALLIVGLIAFIGLESRTLWGEWALLLVDLGQSEKSNVIAYPNIMPIMSYAQRPPNWFHEEQGESLLWQRWVDGVGHRWFHLGKGELDPARITGTDLPFLLRPIDEPVVESRGGEIWTQLPGRSPVVAAKLAGSVCVYPMPVLAKVQVVNDVVAGRPYLVVCDTHAPMRTAVSVYDALWDGRRATMAPTGYYLDTHPLLFDRRTQSLWTQGDSELVALAGKSKGARLPRIDQPAPTPWKDCLARGETIRLVVGADRTHAIPVD